MASKAELEEVAFAVAAAEEVTQLNPTQLSPIVQWPMGKCSNHYTTNLYGTTTTPTAATPPCTTTTNTTTNTTRWWCDPFLSLAEVKQEQEEQPTAAVAQLPTVEPAAEQPKLEQPKQEEPVLKKPRLLWHAEVYIEWILLLKSDITQWLLLHRDHSFCSNDFNGLEDRESCFIFS